MPKRIEVEKDQFYALITKKDENKKESVDTYDESCLYSVPNKEPKKQPKESISKQEVVPTNDNDENLYSQIDKSKTKKVIKHEENLNSSKILSTSPLYHTVEPSTYGVDSSTSMASYNNIDTTLPLSNYPSIISSSSIAESSQFPHVTSNTFSNYTEVTPDNYNQLVPHDLYSEINFELFENKDVPGYECLRSNKTNKIILKNDDETDYETFNDDIGDDSYNYEEITYEAIAQNEKNGKIIPKKSEKKNNKLDKNENVNITNKSTRKEEEKKNNFVRKTQKELKKFLKKSSNKTDDELIPIEKHPKSFENLKDAIKEMPSPFENVRKFFEKNSAKNDNKKISSKREKKNSKKLVKSSMENLQKLSLTQSTEDFDSPINLSSSKTKLSTYLNNFKEKDKYDFTAKKKTLQSDLFFSLNVPSATSLNYVRESDAFINRDPVPLSKSLIFDHSQYYPTLNGKINAHQDSLGRSKKNSGSISNISCSTFKIPHTPRYYKNQSYCRVQEVDDAIAYSKTLQNNKNVQKLSLNSPMFHNVSDISQTIEKATLKQTLSLDTTSNPQYVKESRKSISESSIQYQPESINSSLSAFLDQPVTLDRNIPKSIITKELHLQPLYLAEKTKSHNKDSTTLKMTKSCKSDSQMNIAFDQHKTSLVINNRDACVSNIESYNNDENFESNIYENFNTLAYPAWFKPYISRDEMVELLKNQVVGAFIIRKSSSYHGEYSLGIKVAQLPMQMASKTDVKISDFVRHLLIKQLPNGVRVFGSDIEPIFDDLSSLVLKHSLDALSLPCKLNLHAMDTK